MGKAGAHQIPGAKLALSHAMGGVCQFNEHDPWIEIIINGGKDDEGI